MDPNSSIENENRRMKKFTEEKLNELKLCIKLIQVQTANKMLKKELSGVEPRVFEFAFKTIEISEKVLKDFSEHPDTNVNYIEKLKEKEEVVVRSLEKLKKQSNFFRNKQLYLDEMLRDLLVATAKFEEIAAKQLQ